MPPDRARWQQFFTALLLMAPIVIMVAMILVYKTHP